MYGVSKISSEQNIMLTTFPGASTAHRAWPSTWTFLPRPVLWSI